ncbi:hypothetical protein D9611_005671 [Ephemerocybe angulata]|uniref:Homeobox domain-containing protein n=1 Tax=Ephemerocybe angulata TaxID=980116 RepID=A0A8H5F520_9AGAR|nr:hypothetical protein D9611_005671 [Tulosesus angulatus]
MASPAYRDLWRMLSNVSSSLRKFASPGRTSASLGHDTISDPNPHHPFPPLTLDVPTDFTAFLYDFQISQQALERLLSRADKTVNDLKALHIKSYNGMCNKFYKPDQPSTSSHPKALFDGIKCSHEMAFQRELGRVREEFIKAYEQLRPLSQPKKAVFNTEYTPLLEQYFEYNAFPSARDRDVLARKSSMTARQIEVWFQNHRRRARKDGIQLKRMSSCPLPATLSLERLEKEMPLFIVPKKEKRSTSVDLVVDSEIPEHISPNHRASSPPSRIGNLLDTFSSSTPTTFPAMYRPPGADSENSFFRTARWTFSAPVWRRKPSVLPGKHRTCTSLEDLCTSFSSKLHIAGGVPRKQKDYKHLGRRSTTSSRLPAFSPLTAPG